MTWFPDHIWEGIRGKVTTIDGRPADDVLDEIILKRSPGLREFYENQRDGQKSATTTKGGGQNE